MNCRRLKKGDNQAGNRETGQPLNKTLLCQLLGVSRSGSYKHTGRQEVKDQLLKECVLECLSLNPSYGYRRVALALGLGKKKIRRVMRRFNLKPYKRKARWRKRRDERRQPAIYKNLIKGLFPITSNLIWVSDFTYIKYQGRYLYLCTFMDLFTREIVGWSISHRHAKDLVLDTFWDSVQSTGQLPRVVHSDQGSEYNSREYTGLMTKLNINVSMSSKASPWENGYQKSFYNNFKTDLGLKFDRFNSVGEIIVAIHQTINYYNHERIHTTLKTSPTKFRLLHS